MEDIVTRLRAFHPERANEALQGSVVVIYEIERQQAAKEIERLREYGEKMRQVCIQLSEEIHRLDPSRPVPEI